jgi:hypothetical protein
VEPLPSAGSETGVDQPSRSAQPKDLISRNDAVLAGGESRDLEVEAFLGHPSISSMVH